MNDPFALDLTIILLIFGVGTAMVAGNLAAIIKSRRDNTELFLSRDFWIFGFVACALRIKSSIRLYVDCW